MEDKSKVCPKCGVIHDVDAAGGHDLIEADKVLKCECADHPDDEFCRIVLGIQTYTICGSEATKSDVPQDIFVHDIITGYISDRDEYGWIDFEWSAKFDATTETLKAKVEKWLNAERWEIEVFSVIDESGNVVLTEEDFNE